MQSKPMPPRVARPACRPSALWPPPSGMRPSFPPAATDRSTSTCKMGYEADAARDFDHNALAGTWTVLAEAQDAHDDWTDMVVT